MSFPRYPSYKDSGVPWLGDVPAHWLVQPLKHAVQFRSGGTPDKSNREYWDGDIPWASAKDLKVDNLYDTVDHITQQAVEEGAATLVDQGAVLVVVRGMILARTFPVVTARSPMAINQDLKALRANKHMGKEFLPWLLRGTEPETLDRLDEAGHGTKALRMDAWGAMLIPVPPLEEQVAITAFLDSETAKIDALVAEQDRLIELLKEKRQAVISHAVTKGLDPSVPMKDSGVEWLGEVPAHWQVMPIKRDIEFVTSGARGWAENYTDEGDLFIRIGNLTRDSIRLDLSDTQRVTVPESAEVARTRVLVGDVLFSITAFLGSVAVVPPGLGRAFVSQHVALVRPRGRQLQPEWIAYVTASDVGKTCLESLGYGGTKVQLSLSDVSSLLVTVPPLCEQETLTRFLDCETTSFDALILEAQSAIALLQERRSALIFAAVTGQIDVRNQMA